MSQFQNVPQFRDIVNAHGYTNEQIRDRLLNLGYGIKISLYPIGKAEGEYDFLHFDAKLPLFSADSLNASMLVNMLRGCREYSFVLSKRRDEYALKLDGTRGILQSFGKTVPFEDEKILEGYQQAYSLAYANKAMVDEVDRLNGRIIEHLSLIMRGYFYQELYQQMLVAEPERFGDLTNLVNLMETGEPIEQIWELLLKK